MSNQHQQSRANAARAALSAREQTNDDLATRIQDHLADLKKKEMAIEAERLVAGTGWLPAPLRGVPPKQQADEQESRGEPAHDGALPAFLDTEEMAA